MVTNEDVQFLMLIIRNASEETVRNTVNQLGGKEAALQGLKDKQQEIQEGINCYQNHINKLVGNKQIIESIIDTVKDI